MGIFPVYTVHSVTFCTAAAYFIQYLKSVYGYILNVLLVKLLDISLYFGKIIKTVIAHYNEHLQRKWQGMCKICLTLIITKVVHVRESK